MIAEGWVPRPRLFDVLSTGPKVRVIAAPSGFGKTTLLRGWVDVAATEHRTLVWVALSSQISSRRGFWQLVATSAARRGDIDADVYRALTRAIEVLDDPVPTMQRFFDGRGPTLLVLDAYEHLRTITDQIDDDLVRLVASVTGLELVVTTRAPTRLSGDVLVMRGLTRVIDEADLRFTADEVEQLLALHAPHAVDAAERITRDTQGYPLGVRAVAYAFERLGSMPSFESRAWQRLVTEDLKSQLADPALVDFVLDTSVPPYFDVALARELTGVDDVERVLAELAWNGFGRWIPYTDERPAFQYVDSVRDVLVGQLRAGQPKRYERAAGITAASLHRNGDDDFALSLAIDARQYDLASSICRSLVVSNPDIYTTDKFERHLRRVPRRLLPRYPVLAFILGMVHASNAATRATATEYFRIAAEHALDRIGELTPRETLYQHIGREVSLRYLGRTQQAGAAAAASLEFLDSMSVADRDELSEFLAMALSIMAYSLFQSGDIARAGIVVDQATTSAVTPWWRNYALGFAAGIHALNGRGPEARAALATIEPDAWDLGYVRRVPHALGITGQATLLLDRFDFAGALEAYGSVEWLLDVAESWPFINWVMMHARLGLGEAGIEAHRIEEAISGTPPRPGLGPNVATAALANTLAVLWLADGRIAKAHPLLRTKTPFPGQLAPGRLLAQLVTDDPALAVRNIPGMLAEPGHTVRSAAAVDTLGAAAALRAGNDKTAVELLGRAASRFQLYGVRAHLMYLPNVDLDALRTLAQATNSSVCETYLAGCPVTPIRTNDAAAVRLTPREIAVLSTWAQHRTRAEVAKALFVSANTVRSQLHSAYRKLGVTTKDAAIQRAIELDLLHRTNS